MNAQHTPGPCDQARDIARAVGRERAWLDLTRRFTPQQRYHLANLMAHKWTIQAIEIRGHYDGKCDRIEAEKSHDDAVRELTYGTRPDEAHIEREYAIAQKVNAHDDLLAAAKQAESWIAIQMADNGWPAERLADPPKGSHLFNLRAAIAKAETKP